LVLYSRQFQGLTTTFQRDHHCLFYDRGVSLVIRVYYLKRERLLLLNTLKYYESDDPLPRPFFYPSQVVLNLNDFLMDVVQLKIRAGQNQSLLVSLLIILYIFMSFKIIITFRSGFTTSRRAL